MGRRQAGARTAGGGARARYGLLFEACRARGILHLLVAHHADDQAETVAMRAAHGSGPDGLAGMAALVEQRDARLLRPLLGVSRDRLTATLEARGVAWIDDPSNTDPRFERVRVARRTAALPPSTVQGDGGRAARERAWPRRRSRRSRSSRTAMSRLDRRPSCRGWSAEIAGGPAEPGRSGRGRAGPSAAPRASGAGGGAAFARPAARGKSGKSQDFTLSGCRLMLRQVPAAGGCAGLFGPKMAGGMAGNGASPSFRLHFLLAAGSAPPHVD